MKKQIVHLILLTSLVFSGAAFAQELKVGAAAGASSESAARAGADAGAASQSNNTNNILFEAAPAKTETTVNYSYKDTQKIANVPNVTITGPASGPCTGASAGVGAAFPGFGFGINAAKVDPNCTWRENARVMAMIVPTLPAEDQVIVRKMLMDTLVKLFQSEPQKIVD